MPSESSRLNKKLSTKNWRWDSAILKIVNQEHQLVPHTAAGRTLDEVWNTASQVCTESHSEVKAAFVCLVAYKIEDALSYDIIANLGSASFSLGLITLA